MSLVVIGLNHRTVPLDLLERMTIDDSRLPKALHDVSCREHVSETVVLSTCNRTEVYVVAEKFHGAYADVRNSLGELAFLPPEAFADHLYTYYDTEAAQHLFGVATGIDSAVVGEAEILGQVKHAWAQARHEKTAGPALNMLFRHAIEVGKRARTETGIARNIASVSTAAVAMASARLAGLAGRRILVLGAGDMGEGMVRAVVNGGVNEGAADVLIANRTWERSVELAARFGGAARSIRLADLNAALSDVDLLLTGTGAHSMMLEHGDLERIMAARHGRPLLIVDVAVPRDVDPTAADVPGVTLLDMDDLRAFADAGRRERQREVLAVRTMIEAEVERFMASSSARAVAPLVGAMHERAEVIRAAEVDRYRGRLTAAGFDEAQIEAVEAITRGIVGKLLHEPTINLKAFSGTPKGERLADTLRDLFGLGDDGAGEGDPDLADDGHGDDIERAAARIAIPGAGDPAGA